VGKSAFRGKNENMPLNSDQEMDKHIEVIEEEAKQEGENHTQYVRKEEQKPEEEQAQEKHTISDAPPSPSPTTHSSPGDHKPSSPPLDSSSPSSLSSDRSFHSNELKHPTALPATPSPAAANRAFPADPVVVAAKVNLGAQEGFTSVREVEPGTNNRGGADRRLRPNLSILRRTRRESMVKRALLGLRISGFVFCLISFSVMAADKAQGWALDSFHQYKEFRLVLPACLSVGQLLT
jgi:hypothetical protein